MSLLGEISPTLVIKATLTNLLKGGEAKRKNRIAWGGTTQVVRPNNRPRLKCSPWSAYMVDDGVPLFTKVERTSGLICISLNPEGGGRVSMRKATTLM